MSSPFPPELEKRFSAVKPLGAGGFGAVWLAHQVGLGRSVAIKFLHPELVARAEEVDRFIQEARITAALTHPAVVKVIDYGAVDGRPWIAYELLEGETLAARIERAPLSAVDAARLLAPVARGLAMAHEREIVHRDVKPENIFLDPHGAAKLTDFGIARWSDVSRVKTATGVLIGSPAFLAPELIEGAPPSPASDIYALGITLYNALTGGYPFPDDSIPILLESHLRRIPPPPSASVPGLSPAADQLVERALAKDPQARFPTAADFAAALDHLSGGGGGDATPAPPPRRTTGSRGAPRPSGPSRAVPAASTLRTPIVRTPTIAAAAVAVALVLAAAVFSLWRGSRDGPPPPPPIASKPPALADALRFMECYRGAHDLRARLELTRPLCVELAAWSAGDASPAAVQPAPARPRLNYAVDLTRLNPGSDYRVIASVDGRTLGSVSVTTATEREVKLHLDTLSGPEVLYGVNMNRSAGNVLDARIYLPESQLVAVVRQHPTTDEADRMLDLAEQWDAPELADACLGIGKVPAGGTAKLRLLRVAARHGQVDISKDVDEWAGRADLRDGAAITTYFRALLDLAALGSARADRVTGPMDAVEPLALDVLERAPDAKALFEKWLLDPARVPFAAVGLALAGDPELLDRVRAKLQADPRGRALLPDILALHPGPRGVELVLADLAKGATADQCLALARHPLRASVPALSALVGTAQPPRLRAAALLALGRQGDPASAMAILPALSDGEFRIVRAGAWALARLGPAAAPTALEPLRMLAESDRDRDGVAAWALGEIAPAGDARIAAFLRRIAEQYAANERDLRDQARAALALLAAWRVDRAGAAELAHRLQKTRGQDTLEREAIRLVGGSGSPDDVDVLFPFAPWDQTHRSFARGEIVEVKVINVRRKRAPDGRLEHDTEANKLAPNTPHTELDPCIHNGWPWRPGPRAASVVAAHPGPLLISPYARAAMDPLGDVDTGGLGGASLVTWRVLYRPD